MTKTCETREPNERPRCRSAVACEDVAWRRCARHGSNLPWSIGALVLVLAMYVVSHAPVTRWIVGADPGPTEVIAYRRTWVSQCYQPVFWLTESSCAREALLHWASLWEIDEFIRHVAYLEYGPRADGSG